MTNTAQTGDSRRGAILIDADNVSSCHARQILDVALAYGDASIRRVYANFASPTAAGWTHEAREYGLSCEHVTNNIARKNSTDIALVIDAIELANQGIKSFVIASSDSDFSRLAIKLREHGCEVIVMGKTTTPAYLRASATGFVALEDGQTKALPQPQDTAKENTEKKPPDNPVTRTLKLGKMMASVMQLARRQGITPSQNTPKALPTKKSVISFAEKRVKRSGGTINSAKLADLVYEQFGKDAIHAMGYIKFKNVIDDAPHLRMAKHTIKYQK